MNKKVISFFSFGFLLIIFGAIGKFFNWDQATVILATGLVFESIAILIFAWNKIKNNG
jgi:GldL N-terminal domain